MPLANSEIEMAILIQPLVNSKWIKKFFFYNFISEVIFVVLDLNQDIFIKSVPIYS